MGQVKILRRGDHLPGSTTPHPSGEGLLPLPAPQVEVVQIRLPFAGSSQSEQVTGFYAGSAAFVASPPPSSVPLPGFFAKRGGEGTGLAACDSATSDLRRILRLD
ncbi:hypothetical protein MLD38_014581 [Melastoma candidum]|uniref:Uncharacterized protein n=1 Tax=Melastoma candidum TaxID=119954 RepID=A0ACB9RCW6_9MYRT|nr:hypothetical protein MLD38_014581 [Melastoma candidum]